MNLLIHSDIISLVTGSAKDQLFPGPKFRWIFILIFSFIYLFILFFFLGGGVGGVEVFNHKLVLPIPKWANIGLPLKRRFGGRLMMARH